MKFRILDPACGSGNFLYVAFRELSRLDLHIMSRLHETLSWRICRASAHAQHRDAEAVFRNQTSTPLASNSPKLL